MICPECGNDHMQSQGTGGAHWCTECGTICSVYNHQAPQIVYEARAVCGQFKAQYRERPCPLMAQLTKTCGLNN
jgi:hypothetical protein